MAANLVRLSAERFAQLSHLAAARRTSKAAALDVLFQLGVDAGVIPAEIPGVEVIAVGPYVAITTGSFTLPGIGRSQAIRIADAIDGVAEGTTDSGVEVRFPDGARLEVVRFGRAVALVFTDPDGTSAKKVFGSIAVAHQFAELIRNAAETP
ncbi:hypothetical protein [Alsobacter sp. R-9]